jgi:menaquinone-dependent protoporphyrinogen oxidase
MDGEILISYATTYGSTYEVAEKMAEFIRSTGREVTVEKAKKVKSITGYTLIILGAPLYMFHWSSDAHQFLNRFQKEISQVKIAIFALGPFHNKEDELKEAVSELEKELAKHPDVHPVSIKMFPGKFDPAALKFPYSLIGPLKSMPPSDERDWNAIDLWVQSLLQPEEVKA